MYYKDRHVVPMLPSITPFSTPRHIESYQLPVGISYPWVKEPLPTHGCALVVVLAPLLVIGLFQIKTWSVWDFHAGVVGLLKGVVSTYVTNHFLLILPEGPALTNCEMAGPSYLLS
jgi:hypothetical protein